MIKLTIYDETIDYNKFNFPCGEVSVSVDMSKIDNWTGYPVNILYEYDGDSSIVELLMVADALRRNGMWIQELRIPYVPYGRQDRVCNPGESLSIHVFCDLINQLKAKKVIIIDPHSEVTPALLDGCEVIPQWQIFQRYLDAITEDYWLVSPDAGAGKKVYEAAKRCSSLGILECSKHRDVQTGKITGISLPKDLTLVKNSDVIVVLDDISDKGFTYKYLAETMRVAGFTGKLILMVTHFFGNVGLEPLVEYAEIYSRKGRHK